MKYEVIKTYPETQFRRVTGVKRATFDKMLEILKTVYTQKHKRRGRHAKLCIEDMLLACLSYLREYRTYAHIAATYGVAESNMFRTIKWVEHTLVKAGPFAMSERKALLQDDKEYDVILVGATEMLVERPKKTTPRLSLKEKAAYFEDAVCR